MEKLFIAPQAVYLDYKWDYKDKIIYGSHLFHAYFDGDGKRRPNGANLDWGIPPRLLIEYDSTRRDHLESGVRYYQIFVRILFMDPGMAKAMDGRWREGTAVLSDLVFKSLLVQYILICAFAG